MKILIILLLAALLLFGGCAQLPEEQLPSAELYLMYFYTAETVYTKIIINDSKLIYTYADDFVCEDFTAQMPCWSESDLITKEILLSSQDAKALVDLLEETNFMSLEDTYGGASDTQRYYEYTINARLDGAEKEVVYQSFHSATPMPEEFKKVKDKLVELVDKYF